MTGRISGRLAFLEAARPSSPAGIAVVPYDAGEHGPEHLAQAIEAAQIARKARTGRPATLLIRTGVPRSQERLT